MTIRKAGLADAPDIASIHVDSWNYVYRGIIPEDYIKTVTVQSRRDYWQNEISAGGSVLVSVDAKNDIQGWIAFGRDREFPDDAETNEIYALYVDPKWMRRGVGSRLLRAATETLGGRPGVALTVWVLEKNHDARGFYHQNGFSPTPIKEITITRGGLALVELKLRSFVAQAAETKTA